MKVASTVRRGADGKGTQVTSPAAYPTKGAILANAASIICAHNHPSGDALASEADLAVTSKLKESGRILGIPIEDHVIVGEAGYFSFRQQGLL